MLEKDRFRDFWAQLADVYEGAFTPTKGKRIHSGDQRVLGIFVSSRTLLETELSENFLVVDATDPFEPPHVNESVSKAYERADTWLGFVYPTMGDEPKKLSGIMLFDPTKEMNAKLRDEIARDLPIEVRTVDRSFFQHAINKHGSLHDRFATRASEVLPELEAQVQQLKRDLIRSRNNLTAFEKEYQIFGSRTQRRRAIDAWREDFVMEILHKIGSALAHSMLELLELEQAIVEKNGDQDLRESLRRVQDVHQATEEIVQVLEDRDASYSGNKEVARVRDVGDIISETFAANDISVRTAELGAEAATLKLYLDISGLRHVLFELEKNSRYWISTLDKEPKISVELTFAQTLDGSSDLQIKWRDNGPGINPANKERIFLPTLSWRDEGKGMGLSAIRKFFDDHYGEILECGKEGRGAEFLARLPLQNGEDTGV